jgi:NhaP-type Na+/H+ or K+/H+ antiporter
VDLILKSILAGICIGALLGFLGRILWEVFHHE